MIVKPLTTIVFLWQ